MHIQEIKDTTNYKINQRIKTLIMQGKPLKFSFNVAVSFTAVRMQKGLYGLLRLSQPSPDLTC